MAAITKQEVNQKLLEKVGTSIDKASAEELLFLSKSLEVPAKESSQKSTNSIEFLLKDNTDNISSITFDLSKTGVNHSDVDYFEIVTTGIAFSSDSQLRVEALNSSVSKIGGYMGYSWHANYGGGSFTNNASHNSNNGYIWFPTYKTINKSSKGYYGGGMNMNIKIPVHAITRNGSSYKGIAPISYNTNGWDTSSGTYPENETGTWANYSNSAGWNQDIYGLKLYGSSGSFTDGTIKVIVHLKPKKVGA